MNDKIVPRRKLSVFHRSFDIDTVFETTQDDPENHNLNESVKTDIFIQPHSQNNSIDTYMIKHSVGVNSANISHPHIDGIYDMTASFLSDNTPVKSLSFTSLCEKNHYQDNEDNNGMTVDPTSPCHKQATVESYCSNEADSKYKTHEKNDDIAYKKSQNQLTLLKKIPKSKVIKLKDGNESDNEIENKNDCKAINKCSFKMKRSMSIDEKMNFNNRENKAVIFCRTCQSNRFRQENITLRDPIKNEEFQAPNHEPFQKSEIVDYPVLENTEIYNLSEEELERQYVAFSIGILTDQETLSRRREISIRQRDKTEKNLVSEILKMQHDIQALALPRSDSDTIKLTERARNQIAILLKCAQKVSCAAETVGAVQQEYKLSHAVHLTDRYLKVLRSRCNKYANDLAESKRILSENNIIINASNGELNAELSSTLRFRGQAISSNRTMIARRRASIAAISRSIGNCQENSKANN